MKTLILFIYLITVAPSGYSQGVQEFTELQGDYLGQKPPGLVPEVFARGIVSTDGLEHSAPAFSPDGNEVFWMAGPLMTMRRVEGRWTTSEISPFGGGPFFSPDGKRLYFDLSAPYPDGKGEGPYYVERQGNGWSEQKCVGLVARYPELQYAYNLSITRNGTLYFLGHAEGLGSHNNYGIYRAELIDGVYTKPKLLPRCINMPPFLNWTPYIASDESFVLFSSNRRSESGDGDLYISRRRAEGQWTDPVNLGEPVNSSQQERFPGLSPDGKYLFFTRPTPGHDHDVYWVSVEAVPALRYE